MRCRIDTLPTRLQLPTRRPYALPASGILLLLPCWLTMHAARAQPANPPPGVRILTAEEIEQAGLARLSDLFTLLDAWYATSVEGYAWDVSANGLAAAQEAAWVVLVDGNPVDLRILDAQNLNTLPLPLTEVAYVEVHNTPTFVHGVFAQAGVLHLHTRKPDAGASLRGGFAAGNEVGDPGPFRYTAFTSPNIDRIGPTFQGAASAAGSGWYARVHARSDEHHATDARIRERVRTFYQGLKEPRLLLASVGFDAGTTGRLGRHTVFGGFSRFQDLPFFEPAGLETPTDHFFNHLGVQGDSDPGQPTGISYRLSYTHSRLAPRNNKGGVNFDWRQNTLRGQYEVRTATETLQGALGLSVDLIESGAGVALQDASLRIPRAYGRAGYRLSERAQAHLTAYLTRVKGQPGYGVLATVSVTPAPNQTVTLTGSLTRQPYPEKNSLWYWMDQGYALRVRRPLDVTRPTGYQAATTYTADLAWAFQPSDRLGLTLSGAVRRFDDQTLAAYTFHFDPATTGFMTETVVRNNVFGRVMQFGAEVQIRAAPSLDQRIYYAYLRYPTSDDLFFQAWRRQPWHRFSYTVRYVPLARLSLYARLGYHSETLWAGFLEAARDAGGRYEAALPGAWLLDFSVQKRFWRDHFQLNLSLRNLGNTAYRTHPAGAITHMMFDVRMQVFFNRSRRNP